MSMPFYVAPEQVMKDRADYARKGIARGRSLVALEYADGIALVAENPSGTLHKISEIYDRIAFAARRHGQLHVIDPPHRHRPILAPSPDPRGSSGAVASLGRV
jgi:hypothetical protein